ncbi:MAG: riboflavin synthase [Phycisphaerales bacterium]|nr:MAG: riboflavin synthase [Phycisphaerales bacterium]
MFTGLIHHLGRVDAVEPTPTGVRLRVRPDAWEGPAAPGDSIAIDGVCLTLAEPPVGGVFAFDAIPETMRMTALGDLTPGDRVHMEASATPTTLLGGHIVQGHVDGVAEVISVVSEGEWRVRLRTPSGLEALMVPKGSVTLAGVSLTIAAVDAGRGSWFEVALIPTTLEKTKLGDWKPGTRVNVESDVIARTVAHQLRFLAGPGGVRPGARAGGM